MKQSEIAALLDERLSIHEFEDYGPNGMQVEGDGREVNKVALAVSMTLEVIEQASQWGADLLLCHHGILWKGLNERITGPFKNRIKAILDSGMAALAYHLPLDFHPELGNNVRLARELGLEGIQGILAKGSHHQGVMGNFEGGNLIDLTERIETLLGGHVKLLPFGPEKPNKVAIVTGGGQGYFEKAILEGADCFLTGEASEHNFATAQEYGASFLAAGHYATEKFGVLALGELLEKEAAVETKMFLTSNPI